jgi:hypothetical protein
MRGQRRWSAIGKRGTSLRAGRGGEHFPFFVNSNLFGLAFTMVTGLFRAFSLDSKFEHPSSEQMVAYVGGTNVEIGRL